MVGDDPNQSPLERSDVVLDSFGDHFEHAAVPDADAIEHRALAEDRDAGREVGRLDVGHKPGFEPLSEALLNGRELPWQPVARENQLSPGLVEGVEGVEELLFGLGLAGEELHVVDQQHVRVAIRVFEVLDRA